MGCGIKGVLLRDYLLIAARLFTLFFVSTIVFDGFCEELWQVFVDLLEELGEFRVLAVQLT